MTINATDIKLLESQRMTDTTDGGGRMTNTVILDNVAGNLFPKISRLDAVYGRVNLRKIYMQVDTANLDVYGGANMVLVDPPANPNVGVLLFSTADDFDQRADAKNRIESYVISGVKSSIRLFGDQIIGQKAVLVYQKTTDPLPEIGEVYELSVEGTGYTPAQQFFRITDLKYVDRDFTLTLGTNYVTLTRRVITLSIGYPLIQTFPGAEVSATDASLSPTVIRETNVADAAKYYGIQPLSGTFASGVFSVKAESLFAPIVPSTNRETPISMMKIANSGELVQVGDLFTETDPIESVLNSIFDRPLLRGMLPGSVVITDLYYKDSYADDAKGSLSVPPLNHLLSVDYAAQLIKQLDTNTLWRGNLWGIKYLPAVDINQPPHTKQTLITIATQGTVYSDTFTPIPAPGSLIVDYRSQGRWYRLQDDGTGVLSDGSGSTAIGSGSISYVDGSMVLTLGALPDVGSSLLYSWASPVHYQRLSVVTPTIAPPKITGTLAATSLFDAIEPGSLSISWGSGLTATDDGHGNITGSATGNINYSTHEYSLTPSALPAANTVFQFSYSEASPNSSSPSVQAGSINGRTMTGTIGSGSLRPGSIAINTTVEAGSYGSATQVYTDDGNGNLIASNPQFPAIYTYITSPGSGTIDYVTGNFSITPGSVNYGRWSNDSWAYSPTDINFQSSSVSIAFALAADALTAQTDSATLTQLQIDLTPYTTNSIVPDSLLFTACGRQYYDKSGTLYDQFDSSTGSGTVAGSVDYATGVATLTEWVAASSPALTLQAGLTKIGDFTVTESFFRTPGSPIRPASLYIQISSADGRLLTGTADQNGVITGTEMTGQIQQDMGTVSVQYGKMVAGVWTPTECMPDTLRFSAVVLTQLPLDPTLLGLDPVRLPKDGRVPIYRPGDVVVILNTKDDSAATLSAGQSIQLSRTDLAVVSILDAHGVRLDPSLFTADLPTGVVTMANPLDLSNYTAPFKIRHRIEEMNLVGGTQIDGTLELSSPLQYNHDSTSYVASALLFGDMQAAYTNLFDQATWTNVWSDVLIGSMAAATYDDLNHPIEVLNNGAVTERWRINFTSSTAFQVVGEKLGILATGDTSTDVQIINQLTGQAYFTLRAAGWGLGWAAGNQLRFNTIGAAAPVWLARTVLAGASVTSDSFSIEHRGDIG